MRLPCLVIFLAASAFISCAKHEQATPVSVGAAENPAADTAPRNPCVNLNTATAEELMRLPGIGEVMSRKIIEYRERHGPFRRPEEVIIIEGFSERKYRALAGRVCAR